MAENHRTVIAEPEPVSREEIHAQLRESRRLREEAEGKSERADQTAGEMAKILRRIAAAMDRNPQSWDDLFDGRRE